jgi:CrcB protein
MSVVIGIAVGGAFGVLSRYGLDRFVEQHGESSFPWSTFAINVSGCLLVGFLVAALVDRDSAPEWLGAALVVGFCGGYTTFSTFAQKALHLLEARDVVLALVSIAGNVALGVLAVLAGQRSARLV